MACPGSTMHWMGLTPTALRKRAQPLPACHSGRMLPGAARDQAFRPCTCASQFSVWEWKPTPVPVAPSDRSGGRAVVTVKDVEALRQAGTGRLEVAIGTIVTPLASQRAAEWGIEVSFQ